jgi:dipeptidyl aminopeptidase/acylaminoacyl peptidase
MTARFGIDRFLNIRSCTGPSFSPDGRFVAFLTNVTGVSQLWQVPVEGGWPVQLTFTSESVRGGHYNPIRHEIVYAMDKGGNEKTQVYLLQGVGPANHGLGDGWTTSDLSRHPDAVHTFGGFSPDGESIVFSANREKPSRFDIYIQKLSDTEAHRIARGPGGYYAADGFSHDGRWVLASRTESNYNQDLDIIEVATGTVKHITPHEGEVQYHHAQWKATGGGIWCTTTKGGRNFARVASIDPATGEVEWIDTPDQEIDTLKASPKGRWLAWVLNAGGRSVLKLRDLRSGKNVAVPEMPLGVISQLEFSRDDARLAFVFDGPRYNSDIWVWDVGEAKARPQQLTHASRAGIPFSKFVVPELIHYPTFDDRKIPAWWYPPAVRPTDGRLPPAIVYPHGGPESQTRAAFNPLFQYFLQAGYGILAPNVRGSTGYGTTYMNLDNTTKRMDAVKDLAHAAFWLRDEKKADPKRLAVYGGSYGGFMVLAAVTNYPDLWAAGIDVVGIANFVTFLENTGAYRRGHREAEYGNLRDHREFLEKISPIHHVDRIRCPMMVIHGANDPRVPIGEAEQIVAALKRRGIPVQYLRYEDEGHGLAKLKNRLDAYPKMVAFLDEYLK